MKNGTLYIPVLFLLIILPDRSHATQMHSTAEGVLTHQVGHIFFLISMVTLYITIQGKALQQERGWRSIQLSALFFVLWNLDALLVHFLDNQIFWILTQILSIWEIDIAATTGTPHLSWFYYILRLDHLFCLPGMFFLWRGLKILLANQDSDVNQDPDSEVRRKSDV